MQIVPTSEVLNRAADILQRDGWHQGGYAPDQTEDGIPTTGLPVCAIGALCAAEGAPLYWSADLGCWAGDDMSEAGQALGYYLGGIFPIHVPEWNDSPNRTAAEVIEVLRAVALIEAAKEEASVAESVSA
jgi:hypothetical protein